jgi:heme O synthase-like polyprenyltransferase
MVLKECSRNRVNTSFLKLSSKRPMKWVIRIAVLLVEIGGLFFAIKLVHEKEFSTAFRVFLFESIILIVFVLTHCLIEVILERSTRRNNVRWWL